MEEEWGEIAGMLIPVTPLYVGRVMSKDDAFYIPGTANPFAAHYNMPKIIAKDSWVSMFDLPSPSSPHTPPGTPISPSSRRTSTAYTLLRRSHSLPSTPSPPRTAESDFVYYSRTRRTFSAITPIKKLEEDLVDDTQSEGSSSNDSAVDLRMKDIYNVRNTHRFFSPRKGSVDTQLLNTSWEGRPHSRTELMARCMEAQMAQEWFPHAQARRMHYERHIHYSFQGDEKEEQIPRSYSSSESFISLDESSLMSPTSSYSSYSETDSEIIWGTRQQMELYEARLHSRERFQELVQRWEAKQLQAAAGIKESSPPECADSARALGGIRERGEPSDTHLEKRFQELRQRWEAKKGASQEGAAKGAQKATSDNYGQDAV